MLPTKSCYILLRRCIYIYYLSTRTIHPTRLAEPATTVTMNVQHTVRRGAYLVQSREGVGIPLRPRGRLEHAAAATAANARAALSVGRR